MRQFLGNPWDEFENEDELDEVTETIQTIFETGGFGHNLDFDVEFTPPGHGLDQLISTDDDRDNNDLDTLSEDNFDDVCDDIDDPDYSMGDENDSEISNSDIDELFYEEDDHAPYLIDDVAPSFSPASSDSDQDDEDLPLYSYEEEVHSPHPISDEDIGHPSNSNEEEVPISDEDFPSFLFNSDSDRDDEDITCLPVQPTHSSADENFLPSPSSSDSDQ